MNQIEWTPGPWFSYSRFEKARRWLRYQPAYKVGAFIEWLRWCVRWEMKYRALGEPSGFYHDRDGFEDGEMVGYPCPHTMWELTIMQDARELNRYWTWTPSK